MARQRVLLQPPTKVPGVYTQPEKDALDVGDAKTIVLVAEVYENTSIASTLAFECNADTDSTPFFLPTGSAGGWYPPASLSSIPIPATTTGTFTLVLSNSAIGTLLRWKLTGGNSFMSLSISAYLYDT